MSDEPDSDPSGEETGVDDEALVLGMPSGTSRLPVGEGGEGREGREGEGDILVNGGEEEKREWR